MERTLRLGLTSLVLILPVAEGSVEAAPPGVGLNPLRVALLRWYEAIETLATDFEVGAGPVGVAFDGANIWVVNFGSGTVSKR
ncbi:MAG: hypothetical protein ACRD1R_13625 [Acidobacteriota bacterium]